MYKFTCIVFYIYLLTFTPTISQDDIYHIDDVNIDPALDEQLFKKQVFVPTSFLRPQYGVLFEHVGQLSQSLDTHYIVFGIPLPTYKDLLPVKVTEDYLCPSKAGIIHGFGSVTSLHSGIHATLTEACTIFNNLTQIMTKRLHYLHEQLFRKIHTTIPSLLPNPVVPMFDAPEKMDEHLQRFSNTTNKPKVKRSSPYFPKTHGSFVDKYHHIFYAEHYQEELPSDFKTLYAPESPVSNITLRQRSKRHIVSTILAGIRSGRVFKLFSGGNLFRKVFSGIRKVGGWIYKGLHNLFHHHKHAALTRATSIFSSLRTQARLTLGKLFKVSNFKNLHISLFSLANTLRKKFLHLGPTPAFQQYMEHLNESIHALNPMHISNQQLRLTKFILHAQSTFYFKQLHQLNILLDHIQAYDNLIAGLLLLQQGQLSPSLIPSDHFLRVLSRTTKEVRK